MPNAIKFIFIGLILFAKITIAQSSNDGLLLAEVRDNRENVTKQTPAVKRKDSPSTILYTIGESALGGKIAYIFQPGDPGYDSAVQHGLVVTLTDVSTSAEWGCAGILVAGTNGAPIGKGNLNTLDILAGCNTGGIAAKLCKDLEQGGYSDWYLPSKDELNKLRINRKVLGISDEVYWSSTELDNIISWNQNFLTGEQNYKLKYEMYSVRAVRSF
jgi:hypothetical protein